MKPLIFVSAVSRELKTARQLVSDTLTSLGYAKSQGKKVYYLIAKSDLPRDATPESLDLPREDTPAARADAAERRTPGVIGAKVDRREIHTR